MKWQVIALTFAGTVALVAYARWRKQQPTDFVHVEKLAKFKQYVREQNEEARRRAAFAAEKWSA